MTDRASELGTLREEIAAIDRSIALAVRKRLKIARRIGQRKVAGQEPTRDFGVEAQVLDRWRRVLKDAGVSPDRAEILARWLIEESVRVQGEARSATPRRSDESADIAIVGGAGAMGSWLARFFEDAGHRIAIVDPRAASTGRPTIPDVETAANRVDVLAFATPIRSTAPLLQRALATDTGCLIFDVLSVKAPIANILKAGARAGRKVTSVHPMFGPSAQTLSGRNLLIVSCGVPEADRAARELFGRSAATLAEISLDQHDHLIAESLGLAHAVNLLFLAALSTDPVTSRELATAASTTFSGQSSLARTVAEEGAELYLDIQALNPHSGSLYQELRTALDRLAGIVERKDLSAFVELLQTGTAKLGVGTRALLG